MIDAFCTNGSSPPRNRRAPELLISGGGTVYLIHATSPAGHAWLTENLPPDAPRLGEAIAVEHRYIGPIIEGASADGLLVEAQ